MSPVAFWFQGQRSKRLWINLAKFYEPVVQMPRPAGADILSRRRGDPRAAHRNHSRTFRAGGWRSRECGVAGRSRTRPSGRARDRHHARYPARHRRSPLAPSSSQHSECFRSPRLATSSGRRIFACSDESGPPGPIRCRPQLQPNTSSGSVPRGRRQSPRISTPQSFPNRRPPPPTLSQTSRVAFDRGARLE